MIGVFYAYDADILAGVIQQPLYQILVTFEPKAVTTCADTSYIGLDGYGLSYRECDDRTRNPVSLGIDVEPAQMAVMQQRFTIARMNPELASISEDGLQPHLWWDYADNGTIPNTLSQQPALRFMGWKNNQSKPTTDEDPYFHAQNHPLLPQRMFVTALHTNTTTGVLRQHAMRFNSTVECKHINQSQFPKECPGEKPFQAEFKRQAIRDTGLAVCAPGEFDKFPWTLSRNRQDIVEELYIDLNISSRHESGYSDTVYCKASTTRGYFELGNVYNNQRYGPLMEKWPSRDEMWNEYNDYLLWGWGTEIPMEE
jgi:hypothetical protein